jgi:hypothetical protein
MGWVPQIMWPERAPRGPIADLALVAPRCVLTFGSIAGSIARELEARGVSLDSAGRDPLVALAKLGGANFDAMLVEPGAPAALTLVRAIKQDLVPEDWSALAVRTARLRHHDRPVFLQPMPGEDEYAVLIAPPAVSFLVRPGQLRLVDAIMAPELRLALRRALGL